MIKNKLTYISLFSSAGVGCFGFKKAGFECVATNELIERRLNVQKLNKKCKFDSGYIIGDIKEDSTKNKIFGEIEKWEKLGNDSIDVLIATPPCQGMSVANHKKSENEIERNSLVVESIKMIQKINPKVFIFENVSAFIKTGCTSPSGEIKEIGTVIDEELGEKYIIDSKILNFKNYGSNSSRTRTLVIGVDKDFQEYVSPIELFPDYCKEKTLRQVIGDMPKLKWGEFDPNDFYHQFRIYADNMRKWIHDTKPGKSAFDNDDIEAIPHKVIDGEIVLNVNKNGDKYTRQLWDKVAPCIHTRNDLLASQNTIHPEEDRVFSIRELMKLMTIPDDFKWVEMNLEELNKLELSEKKKILKKEEINIRQSIGEAVPTNIFYSIAKNIKPKFERKFFKIKDINKLIEENKLYDIMNLKQFIVESELDYTTLSKIAELSNSKREQNSAYYTNKFIVSEMIKQLPEIEKDEINIIEPSVGVGNFIPMIIKQYQSHTKVNIDVIDIDPDNIEVLKLLIEKLNVPPNVKINYICSDYLLYNAEKKYDLCIGNPPFTKMKSNDKNLKTYLNNNVNKDSLNLVSFFWEKCINDANVIALVSPKNLLNTPEYLVTRNIINNYKIESIIDNGELGFKGVLVETICLIVNKEQKSKYTNIKSLPQNCSIRQLQRYITDEKYPYWLIYRNTSFDEIANKMEFGIFTVYRDRQLTNSNMKNKKTNDNDIRVIKSRNIDDMGKNIIDITGYDAYIEKEAVNQYAVSKYMDMPNVYLTPNMTYNPRVIRKPKGCLVNGSAAILIPKDESNILTNSELEYFSTKEYREFYKIARNFQTRSLNVDNNSVFFFGRKKGN